MSRDLVGGLMETEPLDFRVWRVVPEVVVVFFRRFGDVAAAFRFVSKDCCVFTSFVGVVLFRLGFVEVVLDERLEVVFGVAVEDTFLRVVFVPGDVEASVLVLRDINHKLNRTEFVLLMGCRNCDNVSLEDLENAMFAHLVRKVKGKFTITTDSGIIKSFDTFNEAKEFIFNGGVQDL